MKKILTGACLLLICLAMQAQSGLQGIIVEKYYVSNANDSIVSAAQGGGNLRVGSVTWRFYADLLPNYKLQAVYGVDVAPTGTVSTGDHELRLQTTTTFFNNEDRGAVTPTYTKAHTALNSVMLDSWFSMGNGCAGYYGVKKTSDNGVSTTANSNGMLLNNDVAAGNLTAQDGLLTGSGAAQAVTRVPATLGDAIFDATSGAGSLFTTYNGSWASLTGSTGPDTSNKILFAQLTTNGTLTYAFNLQIGTPAGGVQRFVAANPVGAEIYNASLSGVLLPLVGCACTTPVTPSAIVVTGGTATVCPGDARTYTVTNVACIDYNWTAPTGATITSGQGTNSISVTYGAGFTANGTISVTASNACGTTSTARSLTITRNVAAQPSTIVVSGGNVKVCPGDVRTYTVTNVSGATYTWIAPSGATVTSGQGTNAVVITYGGGFTANGTISVTAVTACSGTPSLARTLAVNRNVPAAPSVITGLTTEVCTATNQNYSVINVSGITYNWSGTSGIGISSGQGSNAIVASFSSFTTGTLSVTGTNGCGTTTVRNLAITSVPIATSGITTTGGAVKVCPGDTRTYTVTNVVGVTYTWVTPTGGTINSGQGTNSISVTYGAGFIANGTLSVTPSNSCGNGPVKILAIARNVLAAPATIAGTTYDLCGATGVIYASASVSGASSYTWATTTGTFNPVSSTEIATIDFPSTNFTATIKVNANNGCGAGLQKSLTAYAKPAAPLVTGNTTVCNNALETYVATPGASSYSWTLPAGATFVGASNTNTVTVQFGTIPVNPKITVKNYNSCGYNSKITSLVWGSCKTDEATTAIEVEKEMGISDLNVFPNPSSSVFNLSFNSGTDGEQMNIRVFDVAGKLVKEVNELSHSGATNVAVDLSSEASGVYVMSLQTQGVTKRIRLVKQ